MPDTPQLDWEYSRNQLSHKAGPYGNGGRIQRHGREWIIRDCRTPHTYHKPSDGYDLYHWTKRVGHAKTVKELKERAEVLNRTWKPLTNR